MKKFVFAVFVVALSMSANAASCDDAVLSGIVSGLNASAPKRVDDMTTLSGAECINGSLKYVYEMNDTKETAISKFGDSEIKVFKNIQNNILKDLYCTKLMELYQHTNSIIWSYNDTNGKKFAEFEFKPSDCKK